MHSSPHRYPRPSSSAGSLVRLLVAGAVVFLAVIVLVERTGGLGVALLLAAAAATSAFALLRGD